MRLKKHKKGMVLILVLGVLFGIMIMPLLYIRLEEKRFQFDREIGDIQYSAIELYQEADKVLFYVDESARYAVHQAVYDLALNGGFAEVNQALIGYAIWAPGNYPEPKKALPVFVDKYLNEYLAAYPETLPINNYDYFVDQKDKLEVNGIAAINLDFNKEDEKETYSTDYSIKPSFKVIMDYNIYDYELLNQASYEMVNYVANCEGEKTFDECVTESVSDANSKLISRNMQIDEGPNSGRTYGFSAKSSKKVIAYDSSDSKTEFRPVVIKFALEFPSKKTT
ncbi:hypothetical protein ACFLZ6_01300 [Nanoarchaeota archaeon]